MRVFFHMTLGSLTEALDLVTDIYVIVEWIRTEHYVMGLLQLFFNILGMITTGEKKMYKIYIFFLFFVFGFVFLVVFPGKT